MKEKIFRGVWKIFRWRDGQDPLRSFLGYAPVLQYTKNITHFIIHGARSRLGFFVKFVWRSDFVQNFIDFELSKFKSVFKYFNTYLHCRILKMRKFRMEEWMKFLIMDSVIINLITFNHDLWISFKRIINQIKDTCMH